MPRSDVVNSSRVKNSITKKHRPLATNASCFWDPLLNKSCRRHVAREPLPLSRTPKHHPLVAPRDAFASPQ